jgi:V/A-type H+-transporting ATPase subunit F
MKSYLLCKNKETLISLRLAGIEGRLFKEDEKFEESIESLIEDKEIGIIIISEDIADENRDYVMEKKIQSKDTLIIQIPEPDGSKNSDYIMEHIQKTIGIKP